MDKKDEKTNAGLTMDERQRLIEAADRAGRVFERVMKEREEYELRELARKIRTV